MAVVKALSVEEPVLVDHSLGTAVVEHAASGVRVCARMVCVEGGFPAPLPVIDGEAVEPALCRLIIGLAL